MLFFSHRLILDYFCSLDATKQIVIASCLLTTTISLSLSGQSATRTRLCAAGDAPVFYLICAAVTLQNAGISCGSTRVPLRY